MPSRLFSAKKCTLCFCTLLPSSTDGHNPIHLITLSSPLGIPRLAMVDHRHKVSGPKGQDSVHFTNGLRETPVTALGNDCSLVLGQCLMTPPPLSDCDFPSKQKQISILSCLNSLETSVSRCQKLFRSSLPVDPIQDSEAKDPSLEVIMGKFCGPCLWIGGCREFSLPCYFMRYKLRFYIKCSRLWTH